MMHSTALWLLHVMAVERWCECMSASTAEQALLVHHSCGCGLGHMYASISNPGSTAVADLCRRRFGCGLGGTGGQVLYLACIVLTAAVVKHVQQHLTQTQRAAVLRYGPVHGCGMGAAPTTYCEPKKL